MNYTKEELYRLYWEEELSHDDIAKGLGESRRKLSLYMAKLGIPTRSLSDRSTNAYKHKESMMRKCHLSIPRKPMPPEESLRRWYLEELRNLDWIAHNCRVCTATVRKWFKACRIKTRWSSDRVYSNLHDEVLPNALREIESQGGRVIPLAIPDRVYSPDGILLRGAKVYSVELQNRRHNMRKVERAKANGFDGVVFYFIGKANEDTIQTIDFDKENVPSA